MTPFLIAVRAAPVVSNDRGLVDSIDELPCQLRPGLDPRDDIPSSDAEPW